MPARTQGKGIKNPKKRNATTWTKGMPSPNPKGRPKDGESWAHVIKEMSNMTPDDILAMVGTATDLGVAFASMPRHGQMKYLVTARVLSSLMFEPTAGLWTGLMERSEGKVKDEIGLDMKMQLDDRVVQLIEKIYGSAGHPRRNA